MDIAIVGTGYVGLVSGTCFAEMGVNVTCVDVNEEKINSLLEGNIPIYEPELDEMVFRNNKEGRLRFTTDITTCLDKVDIVFSAVGTPPDEDGSADLKYVLEVARTVGRNMNKYLVLVTKSTVPVGTAEKVKAAICEELNKRGVDIPFDVASNPEFLKEGAAIKDFMSPDRVVIGVDSERAKNVMSQLYRPLMLNNFRVIFTDIPSAEMIKYAANSMLATRISFMNDIANLYPGCGYGGSCFPKDVKALIKTAEKHGYEMRVLKAVEEVNQKQKDLLFRKLSGYYGGDLKGRTVTLWGLAFKPETDDMREATSLVMIQKLLDAGCKVRVYDPVAMDECRRRVGDAVEYAVDMYGAVLDSDALLLLTEWKQFRLPSWGVIKKTMNHAVVIDGRNIYDAQELAGWGFDYLCIGNKSYSEDVIPILF